VTFIVKLVGGESISVGSWGGAALASGGGEGGRAAQWLLVAGENLVMSRAVDNKVGLIRI